MNIAHTNGRDLIRYLQLPLVDDDSYGIIAPEALDLYIAKIENILTNYFAHGMAFSKMDQWKKCNWFEQGREEGRLQQYCESVLAGMKHAKAVHAPYVYSG